jgi:dienelactone hydrolase
MLISFRCSQCGREYQAADDWAGMTVACKDCGLSMTVPLASAVPPSLLELDEDGGNDAGSQRAVPTNAGAGVQPSSTRQFKSMAAPAVGPAKPEGAGDGSESSWEKKYAQWGRDWGTVGTLVILAFFGLRAYNALNTVPGARGLQPANARPPISSRPLQVWTMPAFSDLGPGAEIAPGIRFHEVKITSAGAAPGPASDGMAGHHGKLWLYLPAGEHKPRSLPCILIAGAGSNLITGKDLGDGDRPEHLPYVPAGFAVLAYELDGALPGGSEPSNEELARCVTAFAKAEAGTVNAGVAIEFAKARVPAIDPARIYAVGHSSAATVALLVAEQNQWVAACVAFAPATDLAIEYPPNAEQQLERDISAASLLFDQFNPRSGETKINCPLFLFYADDDARFAGQVRELGERLASAGKDVTTVHVSTGGHYESMIQVGVPRAITWLNELAQKPK